MSVKEELQSSSSFTLITTGRIETYQIATYSIRTLLKMDYWSPKHAELLNVKNKINHQISCTLLDYVYIAKWYTVHTISNYPSTFVCKQFLYALKKKENKFKLIILSSRVIFFSVTDITVPVPSTKLNKHPAYSYLYQSYISNTCGAARKTEQHNVVVFITTPQ